MVSNTLNQQCINFNFETTTVKIIHSNTKLAQKVAPFLNCSQIKVAWHESSMMGSIKMEAQE